MNKTVVKILLLILMYLPCKVFAATYYVSPKVNGGTNYTERKITGASATNGVSANVVRSVGFRERYAASFSYSGSTCGTGSYTLNFADGGSETGTIIYKSDWGPEMSVVHGPYKNVQPGLYSNSSNYALYDGYTRDGMYYYKKYRVRCGGSVPPPDADDEYCYCDTRVVGKGTTCGFRKESNASGLYRIDGACEEKKENACYCNTPSIEKGSLCSYMDDGGDSVHRYKISGVDENGCKPPEEEKENPPGVCERNRIKENSDDFSSPVCENTDYETVKFEIEDELCDEEKQYYHIETKEWFKIKYDMNKDGKITNQLDLKSGESFTFDIWVRSEKRSKGEFFAGSWLADYNPLENEFVTIRNRIGKDFGAAKISAAEWTLANTNYDYSCKITNEDGEEVDSTCFDYTAYYEDYNYLQSLRKDSARMYELDGLMEQLESIVTFYQKTYVDMEYVDENKPKVNLKFDYASKGTLYNHSTDFITVDEEYNPTEDPISGGAINRKLLPSASVPKLKKKLARNDMEIKTWDYDYNNIDSPRIWLYAPPKQVVDAITGELKITSAKPTVNGGNRIYTEKKLVDANPYYKLTIKIEELGTDNKTSTIINENCSLKVQKSHLIYRPINVTDTTPSYITGINWINPRYGYNFRGIIKPGSSSNSSSYNLPSSKIKEIQSSNKRIGAEAYLGTCGTSYADAVSRQFCG